MWSVAANCFNFVCYIAYIFSKTLSFRNTECGLLRRRINLLNVALFHKTQEVKGLNAFWRHCIDFIAKTKTGLKKSLELHLWRFTHTGWTFCFPLRLSNPSSLFFPPASISPDPAELFAGQHLSMLQRDKIKIILCVSSSNTASGKFHTKRQAYHKAQVIPPDTCTESKLHLKFLGMQAIWVKWSHVWLWSVCKWTKPFSPQNELLEATEIYVNTVQINKSVM